LGNSTIRQANTFLESERKLIELSSLTISRIQFLQAISEQFRLQSGCAALEFRMADNELQYVWKTDFRGPGHGEAARFAEDTTCGIVPVMETESPLEKVCLDVFRRRYDPITHSEYDLPYRYVEDTRHLINLPGLGSGIQADLSGCGYASMLLLPFEVEANPPGLLIIYAQTREFVPKEDLPAYADLMHSLSIAIKFRRSFYALNERIKELTCLYDINQAFQEGTGNPDELMQKIVEYIPPAFQYPASASAIINVNETEYTSGRDAGQGNFLSSSMQTESRQSVRVRVFYPQQDTAGMPLHFLPEEQKLLDLIAQKIALVQDKLYQDRQLKAVEEQLRHADRLATIGQLGSGIAHELNDPLANILGYAQLLLKTVREPSVAADLERIVRSSLQAREIVRKLLLFARQMPTRLSRVSLNKVIADTLDLLKSRLEYGKVQTFTDLQPDLPELEADPSQLTQLVTNLCVNALQAMPEGGKLNLKTALEQDKIVLQVSDTGVGIAPEEQAKIFLPFYTTKPVGEGTGLGLSVVHGIVESHQGTISVQSKPGRGSRFCVILPVRPARRHA